LQFNQLTLIRLATQQSLIAQRLADKSKSPVMFCAQLCAGLVTYSRINAQQYYQCLLPQTFYYLFIFSSHGYFKIVKLNFVGSKKVEVDITYSSAAPPFHQNLYLNQLDLQMA